MNIQVALATLDTDTILKEMDKHCQRIKNSGDPNRLADECKGYNDMFISMFILNYYTSHIIGTIHDKNLAILRYFAWMKYPKWRDISDGNVNLVLDAGNELLIQLMEDGSVWYGEAVNGKGDSRVYSTTQACLSKELGTWTSH